MAQRCAKHGIGAGPDGRCAICHREQRALSVPSPRPSGSGIGGIWLPVGVALTALAAVAVLKKSGALSSLQTASAALSVSVPSTTQSLHSATSNALEAEKAQDSSHVPTAPALSFNTLPPMAPKEVAVAASSAPLTAVTPSGTPPSSLAPTQADLQRVISSIPIALYEANWCPHCRRAKAWFAGQHLNVTDYDVDHDGQAKRALIQYNPRGSLPTLVIGDKVLVGFSEESVTQTLAAIASQRIGGRVIVRAR